MALCDKAQWQLKVVPYPVIAQSQRLTRRLNSAVTFSNDAQYCFNFSASNDLARTGVCTDPERHLLAFLATAQMIEIMWLSEYCGVAVHCGRHETQAGAAWQQLAMDFHIFGQEANKRHFRGYSRINSLIMAERCSGFSRYRANSSGSRVK